MGSFFQVCSATKLPIQGDDPVVVYVVRDQGDGLLAPVALPIFALYDGYGGVEDDSIDNKDVAKIFLDHMTGAASFSDWMNRQKELDYREYQFVFVHRWAFDLIGKLMQKRGDPKFRQNICRDIEVDMANGVQKACFLRCSSYEYHVSSEFLTATLSSQLQNVRERFEQHLNFCRAEDFMSFEWVSSRGCSEEVEPKDFEAVLLASMKYVRGKLKK